ncbi:hypothetical protein CANARDRAFT_26820 [[Candida] arabinofermentans NRRL YB-2248]|uniref:Uncharacterized protein n=1 Tax=[Candida] arabinofermentans NRRL YB-2248 TaxID=983967 RepID=A0A1E4T6N5_9ASCO|nr:hypothetical protein CANARDRAFT_26820 [[Candida] arabinofermentans NRRL YB-2248]
MGIENNIFFAFQYNCKCRTIEGRVRIRLHFPNSFPPSTPSGCNYLYPGSPPGTNTAPNKNPPRATH